MNSDIQFRLLFHIRLWMILPIKTKIVTEINIHYLSRKVKSDEKTQLIWDKTEDHCISSSSH